VSAPFRTAIIDNKPVPVPISRTLQALPLSLMRLIAAMMPSSYFLFCEKED